MSLADVQITLARHALIARLVGEIDMSNAEDLGATVIGATPNEAAGVVLDLSAVDYLDSAGIYVVFGMRPSLQARGQSLILVVPAESPVHDALRLAGVERPGEVAATVDEAVRAIDRPSPTDA
jgi:anti-sigma B factor antagonist